MDTTASAPSSAVRPLEDVATRAIAGYRRALAEIDTLRERIASLETELEGSREPPQVVRLEPVPDLDEELGLRSVEELELEDEGVRSAARRRSMRKIERRLGKLGTAAANR